MLGQVDDAAVEDVLAMQLATVSGLPQVFWWPQTADGLPQVRITLERLGERQTATHEVTASGWMLAELLYPIADSAAATTAAKALKAAFAPTDDPLGGLVTLDYAELRTVDRIGDVLILPVRVGWRVFQE